MGVLFQEIGLSLASLEQKRRAIVIVVAETVYVAPEQPKAFIAG